MKKNEKALSILSTAEQLFLEQGYRATSMREIASRCGVGLGLIIYHYESKFELAKACLQRQFQMIEERVGSVVDFETDTLLYHATYLRFSNWHFLRPQMRELYYECLEEGIYSAYIYETVPKTLRRLNALYQSGLSEDYILLYGNYLPADLEKTLVLQKRKGLFSQISYEEIPTIVFENAVSQFGLEQALLHKISERAAQLCAQLIAQMERDC